MPTGGGAVPKVLTVAADTQVDADRGYVYALSVRAAAAAGVVTLYDGAIANAKIIASVSAPINTTNSVMLPKPVPYTTLRSAVTGAGVVAIAYIGQ